MSFDEILKTENFKSACEKLYGEFDENQIGRYQSLLDLHKAETGFDAEYFYSAPGRIEIIGNHTDHNAGKVLCAAISVDTLGAVSKRDDGIIIVKSKGYPAIKVDINEISFDVKELGSSTAIIKGILDYYLHAGKKVGGFNAYTVSSVPKGSGVSSSSAFELLIAEILNDLYNDGALDPVFKAKASQYAESAFFGKPCGLMDQSAISLGGVNMIDFKSFEEPYIERAKWDFSDLDIYVIATGGDHCDLTADYAAIPAEMKSVATALGGKLLRDIAPETFYEKEKSLIGKVKERALLRAEHYYEENARVDDAAHAISSGDEKAFLTDVNESGLSSKYKLQNLYSPKGGNHNIEKALDIVETVNGVVAKRVHGGGFAGTILVFVKKDSSNDANDKFNSLFGQQNVFRLAIRNSGAIRVF